MKPPLTVHIPNPCHENWHDMTPTARGAHCAACNKEVIDFTHRTDHYIYQALQGRTDVCGRFLRTQVGRSIEVPERPVLPPWMRRMAATVVSVFALYKAAAVPDQVPRIDTATLQVDTTRHLIGDTIVSEARRPALSGYVRDRETDCPIANASIRIVGSQLTVYTDIDGYFSFDSLPQRVRLPQADATQATGDTTSAYTWTSEPEDTVAGSDTIRLLVRNGGYRTRYMTVDSAYAIVDIELSATSHDTAAHYIAYVNDIMGMVSTPLPDPVPDPTVQYSDAYLPGPRLSRAVPLTSPPAPAQNGHLIYADRFILWLRQRREGIRRWLK